MFRRFIVIAFLLSFVVSVVGQAPQIQTRARPGTRTYNITNNRTDVEGWFKAADTTAMIAYSASEGTGIILKQLASGNKHGGGTFIALLKTALVDAIGDSTANSITLFPHSTATLLWARQMYIDNPYMISVEWAGAKGDSSTNDATAIQATIDLVRNMQRVAFSTTDQASRRPTYSPTIIIPSGTYGIYKINTVITVYTGMRLEFQGSILRAGTTGMVMLKTPDDAESEPNFVSYANRNIQLINVALDGANIAGHGLLLETVTDCIVQNPRIYRVLGDAFADKSVTSVGASKDSLICNNVTGLYLNAWVSVVGDSGLFSIEWMDGDTVVLDHNLTAQVSGAVMSNISTGLSIHKAVTTKVYNAEIINCELGMGFSTNRDGTVSTTIQNYAAHIEDCHYGVMIGKARSVSFYDLVAEHSRRGSELIVASAGDYPSFFNSYFEGAVSDTVTTYGFRATPLINIQSGAVGSFFSGLMFPQNGPTSGWRRLMSNRGTGTVVQFLKTSADTLVENPDRANDYALIECYDAGSISLMFEEGQTSITNPINFIINESGNYPLNATVLVQGAPGWRMSGLQRHYEETGSDPIIQLYSTDTTAIAAQPRMTIALNGIYFGQTPDTLAPDTRLYSDYPNRMRVADGDIFWVAGDWNGGHLKVGTWRLWEDADGYFRADGTGDPSADKDGEEFFLGDSIRSDADSVYIYINGKYSALLLKAIP